MSHDRLYLRNILDAKAEVGRELAYRLDNLFERKKRAAEALAYNGLVQSWPGITRLLARSPLPVVFRSRTRMNGQD